MIGNGLVAVQRRTGYKVINKDLFFLEDSEKRRGNNIKKNILGPFAAELMEKTLLCDSNKLEGFPLGLFPFLKLFQTNQENEILKLRTLW